MVLKHLFTTNPLLVGVYSNFNNFMYDQYKIDLVCAFLFRTLSIVSDFSRFDTEVSHLKVILRKIAFPIKLVASCTKTFLNKKFLHTPVALTVEKSTFLLSYHILAFFFSCFKNTFTE